MTATSPSPTAAAAPEPTAAPAPPDAHPDMVWVPGGTFAMGSDEHYPEEAPVHQVRVDGFWMDRFPVTNVDFLRFVRATGYVSEAEKAPRAEDYPGAIPAMLVPGSTVFVRPTRWVDLSNHYNWWHWVPGADWRHPHGPDSSLVNLDRYPVVQMAYADVLAYAAWVGREIPTEAEFEFAARGGLDGAEYAWGDEFTPGGRHMANTWQGEFPHENTGVDGYVGTSPVGAYPPNGYGLYDVIGNVWEWTTDFYATEHLVESACCTLDNPRGASAADSADPTMPEIVIPRRVIKGGSHLCAPNYCRRYRPAARMAQPVDTGTNHLGFRLILHVPTGGAG